MAKWSLSGMVAEKAFIIPPKEIDAEFFKKRIKELEIERDKHINGCMEWQGIDDTIQINKYILNNELNGFFTRFKIL